MKAANICSVGVTEREERDKRAESSVKKLIPKTSKLGVRNRQPIGKTGEFTDRCILNNMLLNNKCVK